MRILVARFTFFTTVVSATTKLLAGQSFRQAQPPRRWDRVVLIRINSSTRRGSGVGLIATVAVVGTAISVLLPLSYDEAYWLGISRMWRGGAVLYESAIDNKSPLVYMLYALVDLLPGPFQFTRGIFVGVLILVAGLITKELAVSAEPRSNAVLPAVLLAVILLLGEFKLYTEVMASPLILGALASARRGSAVCAVTLGYLAAFVTPLAACVVPVVLWMAWRAGSTRFYAAIGVTVLTFAVACVVIGSSANLKFGLLELNLASRQTVGPITSVPSIVERTSFTIVAMAPAVVVGLASRWVKASWMTLLVASLLPIAAGWYLHYWIVPTLFALFLASGRDANLPFRWVVWSAVPLFLLSTLLVVDSKETAQAYGKVTERLELIEEFEWTFIQLDTQPFVAARFPDRALLRSPSIHYLLWDTSRSDEHKAEFSRMVATADVLIGPSRDELVHVSSTMTPLVPDFRDAIPSFTCASRSEHLTVYMRESLCAKEDAEDQ